MGTAALPRGQHHVVSRIDFFYLKLPFKCLSSPSLLFWCLRDTMVSELNSHCHFDRFILCTIDLLSACKERVYIVACATARQCSVIIFFLNNMYSMCYEKKVRMNHVFLFEKQQLFLCLSVILNTTSR